MAGGSDRNFSQGVIRRVPHLTPAPVPKTARGYTTAVDERPGFFRGLLGAMLIELALVAFAAAWAYDAAVNGRGAGWALFGIGLALLAALAVRAGSALLKQRGWTQPTFELARTIEQLRNGNWAARVRQQGEPSVADAAFRLNMLAEQTQTQLTDLRHQRDDLIALVDSLPDPIVTADAQQRVTQLNAPAAVLLSVTARQARGQNIVSVLGESSLVDLCEALPRKPNATLSREITLTRVGQKFVYAAVASRTSDGGLLLTLSDITKLTQTVQMKTDFVANASHELRTPITAIKIAFDTLGEVYTEDPAQSARCLQIIGGHMKRLEDMLQDLLDLSRVENAEVKPEWTEARSFDVLTTVRTAMGAQAENKGVTLDTIDECNGSFVTERKLVDLVLKNLVENAVKFTPAGGKVTVTLGRQEEGHVVLRVADSGIGIPPQHLERVFERFYQVDAARSGTSGRGTGLGLAIVKHAVAALGGQVTVDSLVGRGTTFTCVLPPIAALAPAKTSDAD